MALLRWSGEAIVCDDSGLAVFRLIRNFRLGDAAMLCAFDLIEVNGEDLRREPIQDRKLALNKLLYKSRSGVAYNRRGRDLFKNASTLWCEGIVSKRLGSPCRSGRSADWIKVKNPSPQR
jgi:bifunctional non-homologous end joining protein LigD